MVGDGLDDNGVRSPAVTEGFHLIIASGQAVGPTDPFVQSLSVAVSGGGGGRAGG